ncbi:MAG TPA: glycosyltransferase [Pyrinomonadaceae bacterium]|nr:glycosyltransferase [Pyrinomonadaceae bacterium]
MKVSVIIPNYNYSKYVCEAVESALGQTYQNKEVIVVDDGSTDSSVELLAKYGDKIRLIAQKNAGVCAARNNGVAASTGELIAFLDADDVWMPEKLEKQVAQFLADPNVVLSHVGMEDIDANDTVLATHLDGMSGKVSSHMLLFEEAVILGACSGAVVRRKPFETLGGFDKRMSTAADWDFCFRISRLGSIAFVPEPLLKYRFHGSNMHGNIRVMEHDTLIAWRNAFDTADESIRGLRPRSYGNLHKVLAGSYLRSGQYGGFVRNLVKSLWFRPSYLGYYLSLLVGRKSSK